MQHDSRLVRYFIYYVATLLFFGVGAITTLGLPWYESLELPSWIPSPLLVAGLWCVLFVSTALSAAVFWERAARGGWSRNERLTIFLFMGNALVVLLWNYLFFGLHELGSSLLAACLVGLSAVALMARTWRNAHVASYLLVPYIAWMAFAVYFNYAVALLN